jgi:lipopolysaccharide transport system permease protein
MNRTIIEANKSNFSLNLKELFEYRELLFMLSYRDFRVRYAHTFLGVLWAIVQPLFTVLILTLIFGKAVKVDTGGVPYPLYAMAGMLAWNYFSFVISQAGNSIISAQALISKIYFPRLIIPVSRSVIGCADFLISFIFLVLLFIYYDFPIHKRIVLLPVMFVLLMLTSLSAGIWLSALTIRYRDVQHIIPFLAQVGLYITPVAYPASMISQEFLSLYYLNPMASLIDIFRWGLIGIPLPEPGYIATSMLFMVLLLISGLYYFKRTERVVADIV